MNLYTITIGRRTLAWAGTQADAKASKREQESKHPGAAVTWQEREVPTDKAGLLAFLNAHCVDKPAAPEAPSGE